METQYQEDDYEEEEFFEQLSEDIHELNEEMRARASIDNLLKTLMPESKNYGQKTN